MKLLTDLIQGSAEWLEIRSKHFTASEAPAMLGLSKYVKRRELLHQKATGETPEITPQQQKLFDRGHQVEELARPIAEETLGEELYPVTAINEVAGLPLLASMDGLTMLGDTGFEHKLFNQAFADMVESGVVPDTHWPQLEHQMLVTNAEQILFVVSDGTEQKWAEVSYKSQPERRQQVISGWVQFAKDLAEYMPEEANEGVVAQPVRELPAISYNMQGLALQSNLEAYKVAATELVEKSKQTLESDQDFADADARQKIFTKAEKDIKEACERVMGEIDSIDAFVKDMRFIGENIRQARLAEAKQIKARKEQLRKDIEQAAQIAIGEAVSEAAKKVNAQIPTLNVNVSGAMKGKRTIESLQDAADGEVAKAKIQITEFVNIALANMNVIADNREYDFLFNDWATIAFKATEDFIALAKARIAEHKERERIRLEEIAKLQRESEAKAQQEKANLEQAAQAEPETQSVATVSVDEAPKTNSVETAETITYRPAVSRQFSAMEINAIIQFVAWVDAPYAEDLKRLSDEFIQQKTNKAA